MFEKIALILKQECKLDHQKPTILGISGGADSLCLLDIFWRLKYNVIVAHLDHKLRPESRGESQSVKKAAEDYGIPFYLDAKDVNQIAAQQKQSIEEAARYARYNFLFRLANKLNAQAVAVGHNADDQVETVLMHFLRGAGSAGLRGMSFRHLPNTWSSFIPIVRPLLSSWRMEVSNYLEERNISPSLDASNLDTRYYRNRIRLDLIPYLENYNPNIRRLIFQMADIINDEHSFILETAKAAWDSVITQKHSQYLCIDRARFQPIPIAVKKQLFLISVNYLRPNLRDVDFHIIEKALYFSGKAGGSQSCNLLAGLSMLVEGNQLWIYNTETELPDDQWPQVKNSLQASLDIPGEFSLNKHWSLKTEIMVMTPSLKKTIFHNSDAYTAWLNAEHITSPLSIRIRKSGDRYHPLGMNNHTAKVSDLMINQKIPSRARIKWPVICYGEEIIWIPGFPPSLRHSIKETSRTVIQIKLIQL